MKQAIPGVDGGKAAVRFLNAVPKKSCAVPGCPLSADSRGWCNRHYQKWLRWGDPTAPTPPRPKHRTLVQCLCAKIILATEAGGCWHWNAGHDRDGYALFSAIGEQRAARVVYRLFIGSIPDGKQIDHLCRVRGCVNPAHLEPVTIRENLMRGVGHAATNARKTHCLRGHPLTGENMVRRDGRRRCRECMRYRDRQQYARERSA